MTKRATGWVQDPGEVRKLRRVVEIFDRDSETHAAVRDELIPDLISDEDGKGRLLEQLSKRPLSLEYRDLVGTSFRPRGSARCNGIIQAAVEGQRRPFISDWPADNFLRWAESLGFVERVEGTERYRITRSGLSLSGSDSGSEEEYEIYKSAFLSYPPVSRIINLLTDAMNTGVGSLTKFEIGKNLGFIGEEGFTSISQNLFVRELSTASPHEKKEIKQNWEGDSDKYARMICGWLTQLKHPWVERVKKEVPINFMNMESSQELQAYALTGTGYEVRKMISGKSKFRKVPKIVHFGMLCTKGKDRGYLRARRAHIINSLKREKSLDMIREDLRKKGIDEGLDTIKEDLRGLTNIGLSIGRRGEKYRCTDEIVGLKIPESGAEETQKSDILNLMTECKGRISEELRPYVVLIQMGFNRKHSLMFEIKTLELLTEHCNFGGRHLGGARRPDGVIYSEEYGVIVDTKSYADGFNISASEMDKMKRYIEENRRRNPEHNRTEWWNNFPPEVKEFFFLFVSGKFVGQFRRQMEILSDQTDTLGASLSSYTLLIIAEQFRQNRLDHGGFKRKISVLDEVGDNDPAD